MQGHSAPTPDPTLHGDFPLSAIDVSASGSRAHVFLSGPRRSADHLRDEAQLPRTLAIDPGPPTPYPLGLALWLLGLLMILAAIPTAIHRRRSTATVGRIRSS